MTVATGLYLSGFALLLTLVLRKLVSYSSDIRNANGMPWFLGWWNPSRDTTVSAYDRQGREHDLLLDDQAEAAMANVTERTVEIERIQTEERTAG